MKFKIYASIIALTVGFISCQNDDKITEEISSTKSNSEAGRPTPPISAGTADDIAAADLIAYWPLNGNGIESKSATAPNNTVNTTWVAGQKGQAAHFAAGFMDYPSIPELNNPAGSITVSCWAKLMNTRLVPEEQGHISTIISFTSGFSTPSQFGSLSLFGETHGLISSDTIQMKAVFQLEMPDHTPFMGDCAHLIRMDDWSITENANGQMPPHEAHANKIGGQWAQIVYVYDGSNANNRLYVNGVKISNPPWESRYNGIALPMNFFQPSHPTIGATPPVAEGSNIEPWNAALTGDVDEIRVWKKALTLGQIRTLYRYEKAGR